MLLELRRPGPLDRPVTAVVRPHGQLVDQQATGDLEHLHREQAGHVELGRDPQGQRLGLLGPVLGQTGRGRDHLPADPVPLNRLDHRVGRSLSVRRPRDQRGQLPVERDVLLGQHGQAERDHFGRFAR